MGRQAAKVYTDPGDIALLERTAMDLPMDARVRITTRRQAILEGIVAAAPTVQMFYDLDGNEGINGVVKLEDPARPLWKGEIWLSEIVEVDQLNYMPPDADRA